MTSIRKLARLAGVSSTTVFRALHNDPNINALTRQRIMELADLYQYRPVTVQTVNPETANRTIGMLVPGLPSYYNGALLSGVLEEAFLESYHVVVLRTHNVLLHTLTAMETLAELGVRGILIASGHYAPIPRSFVMEMWSQGIELVTMEVTNVAAPLDRVWTDEERLAEIAVEYLLGLGHREIVFALPTLGNTDVGRPAALKRALRRHGISTAWILDIEGHEDQIVATAMQRSPQPTALLAMDDTVAAACIQQANQLGLRVPQDLSILGCANFPFAQYLSPALTTIEQYPVEVGRQAAALLFRRIGEDRQQSPRQFETVSITPVLVERNSCGRPRARR
jgi:LacI family transcriptional regulator